MFKADSMFLVFSLTLAISPLPLCAMLNKWASIVLFQVDGIYIVLLRYQNEIHDSAVTECADGRFCWSYCGGAY